MEIPGNRCTRKQIKDIEKINKLHLIDKLKLQHKELKL